jgi:hypothetical protein
MDLNLIIHIYRKLFMTLSVNNRIFTIETKGVPMERRDSFFLLASDTYKIYSSVKALCCFSSACRGRLFPGSGFYLCTFLIQHAGFLYWKIKTKRKRALGRRRLADPSGRSPPGKTSIIEIHALLPPVLRFLLRSLITSPTQSLL